MIKISHEIPISLLKQSRQFNDYEYVLCHLYDEREDYKAFYDESVKKGRHVLLDNSIFELGTAFDSKEYARIINELQPTEYIVPDVTDSGEGTIELFEKWLKNYAKECPGVMMGVVHGKDYKDVKECITYLASHCDRIAINFHDGVFGDIGQGKNKYEKMMDGRCRVLQMLEDDLCLPRNKSYHLLGASLPQEYMYANHFDFTKKMFTSLDTSNPVVHGIRGVKYKGVDGLEGLNSKESIKLADLIDHQVTKTELNNILYNVKAFRKIVQSSGYNHDNGIYFYKK